MAKKRRDRRSFSEEFKQQLIDEIKGGRKLIDVAEEHGLQPSQLSLWKKKLGAASGKAKKATRGRSAGKAKAAAPAAPRVSAAPATSAPVASRVSASSSSIAELERVIGQLTIENMRLRQQLESK